MANTSTKIMFSMLLSLLLVSFSGVEGAPPAPCKRYECPNYDVIQVGKDYEIRRYNSPVWISNYPNEETSLVKATIAGVHRLFSYIHGNNTYKQEIEMTAPVASEVSRSDGKSSIIVSFYVPKKNQANPPPAEGLYVQRWKSTYAAVRQFDGFVKDSNVGQQVAALNASLAGTKWGANVPTSYTVAQYNAPFELFNRVNEIWFLYKSIE